jgi:hypothetical protein
MSTQIITCSVLQVTRCKFEASAALDSMIFELWTIPLVMQAMQNDTQTDSLHFLLMLTNTLDFS